MTLVFPLPVSRSPPTPPSLLLLHLLLLSSSLLILRTILTFLTLFLHSYDSSPPQSPFSLSLSFIISSASSFTHSPSSPSLLVFITSSSSASSFTPSLPFPSSQEPRINRVGQGSPLEGRAVHASAASSPYEQRAIREAAAATGKHSGGSAHQRWPNRRPPAAIRGSEDAPNYLISN